MPFDIQKTRLSPNCDKKAIKVEFLVLHYTAAFFADTLNLFLSSVSRVSSHLIIDVTGQVYEVVDCMKGQCFRAWHAGESYLETKDKRWKNFNDFSIGIELVNLNGNLFAYSKEQYESLKEVIKKLKTHYPALRNPNRALGHEHIASHRGKVDPGYCFDWALFFKMNYGLSASLRKPNLTHKQRKLFLDEAKANKQVKESEYWMTLNKQMESVRKA